MTSPPFRTIRLETDARGVAQLTLERPERHNALDAAMIAELTEAAGRIAAEPAIRAVVLTGAGPSFCAGGDLGWMKSQIAAGRETRIEGALCLARMLKALNELPVPVIARVNGQAYGGGVGMMAVCDTVIAVEEARFGLTEVRLGLIPATISPYVVGRIGPVAAREVMLSGARFGIDEARRIGLVTRAVAAPELDAAVEAEIEPILASAPGAIAGTKALIRRLAPQVDETLLRETADLLADRWETQETSEGIDAFFEKRAPKWRAG